MKTLTQDKLRGLLDQCVIIYIRGREPMAREPDVAHLITAPGSFVTKHKLPHIKEKDLRTQDFKSKDPFLRTKSRNQSQIEGENLFFLVLETPTFLRQKLRNQNNFALEQISAHTHTAKN